MREGEDLLVRGQCCSLCLLAAKLLAQALKPLKHVGKDIRLGGGGGGGGNRPATAGRCYHVKHLEL